MLAVYTRSGCFLVLSKLLLAYYKGVPESVRNVFITGKVTMAMRILSELVLINPKV